MEYAVSTLLIANTIMDTLRMPAENADCRLVQSCEMPSTNLSDEECDRQLAKHAIPDSKSISSSISKMLDNAIIISSITLGYQEL